MTVGDVIRADQAEDIELDECKCDEFYHADEYAHDICPMCRLNLLKIKELIVHEQFSRLLAHSNYEIFIDLIHRLEPEYIEVLL